MGAAKDKGSRLERLVAEQLRRSGLDPKASRMPLSGADSHLKGDVRTELPYTIECKNTERIQLWKSWEQAREQSHYHPPLLCVTSNYRPVLAVMDLDTLVHLLQCEKQLESAVYAQTAPPSGTGKRSRLKRKVDGTVVPREET